MNRIRRARLTDIEGMADVVKDVWEQDVLPDVCKAQIEDTRSALWVATDDADNAQPEAVLGFASAFLTIDMNGNRRWEVDLVGVRPGSQGRGLGTQLIRHVCEVGESNKVSLARALIRVENIASQRAFEHVGFTTDGQLQHLLLWAPKPGAASMPDLKDIAVLPVETVTYRGLWIEGLENLPAGKQRSVVRAARAAIARDKRLNTGAVIPTDREQGLAIDLRRQARVHGKYYWYIKPGAKM